MRSLPFCLQIENLEIAPSLELSLHDNSGITSALFELIVSSFSTNVNPAD